MSAAPKLLTALKFSVEVLSGPHQGEKLSFEQLKVAVGRGPENDIVLSQDVKVSRQHVELQVSKMEYFFAA